MYRLKNGVLSLNKNLMGVIGLESKNYPHPRETAQNQQKHPWVGVGRGQFTQYIFTKIYLRGYIL